MDTFVDIVRIEKVCNNCKKIIWTDQDLRDVIGKIGSGETKQIYCTCSCGKITKETIKVFITIEDVDKIPNESKDVREKL